MDVLEAFTPPDSDSKGQVDLKGFILGAYPALVLDTIEVFESRLTEENDWRATFRQEINEAFEDYKCPWRLSDGEFFRVDIEFMEAVVVERTEEILKAEGLQGPHEEFREARDDLTDGDYKGAITNACKAFESTLKAILSREDGSAAELLAAFVAGGFCDDIPEKIRRGFRDQVLKAIPFLRNKLGAHGQGNEVIQVPKAYAQLAVHLAGSFIQFVISQGTAHKAEDNGPFMPEDDDDVPF